MPRARSFVETALVKLIEENGTDTFQEGIILEEAEQDAGRNGEDASARAPAAVEANLVADLVSQLPLSFCSHAPRCGPGGEAAGLQQDDTTAACQTASSRAGGTRVVLPAPVGARSTAQDCRRSASSSSGRTGSIGNGTRMAWPVFVAQLLRLLSTRGSPSNCT